MSARIRMLKRTTVMALLGAALLAPAAHAADDGDSNGAAVAKVRNADAESVGMIEIYGGPEGAVISLELSGMPPGWHAIHVHHQGICDDHDDGFKASGGHVDPGDREHGLLNADGPELGDLPNIWVHEDGRVKAELYAPGLTLDDSKTGLFDDDGSAFVIHEDADDHRTQPIGGAGGRIACGVVEDK